MTISLFLSFKKYSAQIKRDKYSRIWIMEQRRRRTNLQTRCWSLTELSLHSMNLHTAKGQRVSDYQIADQGMTE